MLGKLFQLGQTSPDAAKAAIANMAAGVGSQATVQVLEGAVAQASKTGADGGALQEWLANGDYDGSETVESLAAEWDGDRE